MQANKITCVILSVCFVLTVFGVTAYAGVDSEWSELSAANVNRPPRDSHGNLIKPPAGKYWKQIGEKDADGIMFASYWELRDKENKKKKPHLKGPLPKKNTGVPVANQVGRGLTNLFHNFGKTGGGVNGGDGEGLGGGGDFVDTPSGGGGQILQHEGGGGDIGGGYPGQR